MIQEKFETSIISKNGQYTKNVLSVFDTDIDSLLLFDNPEDKQFFGIRLEKKQIESGLDLVITLTNNSQKTLELPVTNFKFQKEFQPDSFQIFNQSLEEVDFEANSDSESGLHCPCVIFSNKEQDISIGFSSDINQRYTITYDSKLNFLSKYILSSNDYAHQYNQVIKPGKSITYRMWFRAIDNKISDFYGTVEPYFSYIKKFRKPSHNKNLLKSRVLFVEMSSESRVSSNNPRGFFEFSGKRADTCSGWNELLDSIIEHYGGIRNFKKYGYHAILLYGISGIEYKNDIASYIPLNLKNTFNQLTSWKKDKNIKIIAGVDNIFSYYDVYNNRPKTSITPNGSFTTAAKNSFSNNYGYGLKFYDGIYSEKSLRPTINYNTEYEIKKLRDKYPESILVFGDCFSINDCRFSSPVYSYYNLKTNVETIKLYADTQSYYLADENNVQNIEKTSNIPITKSLILIESVWGEPMSSEYYTDYQFDRTIYTATNVVKDPYDDTQSYDSDDYFVTVETDYLGNSNSHVVLYCSVKNIHATDTKSIPTFSIDLQWNENDGIKALVDAWGSAESVRKIRENKELFSDTFLEDATLNKFKLDTAMYGLNLNGISIGNGLSSVSDGISPYIITVCTDLKYKCEFNLSVGTTGTRKIINVKPLAHTRDPDYTSEKQSRGNVFRKIRVPEKLLKPGETLQFKIYIKAIKNTDNTSITDDDVIFSMNELIDDLNANCPANRCSVSLNKRILGFDVSTNLLGTYNAVTNPRGYVSVNGLRFDEYDNWKSYLDGIINQVASSKSNFLELGYGAIALSGINGFHPGGLYPKPTDFISCPESMQEWGQINLWKQENPNIKLFLILNYGFKWYQPVTNTLENWKCDSKQTRSGGEYYLEHSVQFPQYRGGSYGGVSSTAWSRPSFTEAAISHYEEYFPYIMPYFDGIIFDDALLPHQDSCVNGELLKLRTNYPDKFLFLRNSHTIYDTQYFNYYFNHKRNVSYPTKYSFEHFNMLYQNYSTPGQEHTGIVEVLDPTDATEMEAVESNGLCPLTMNVVSTVPSSYLEV